jgi:methionine aminopeptidase
MNTMIKSENKKSLFNLDTLTKLGTHHKKLMCELEKQLDSFISDKDIYTYVNNYIEQNNLGKAFPIGISINHIIAHDSFHESEIKKLKKGDFVKIDVGLIEQGNIIDSARTFVYKDITPQCIIDCKLIAKGVENSINKDIENNGKVLIQKISAHTNALIGMKGYLALDYLGGHTIEYGKVHGDKLILNKPRKLLPKEAQIYIDPNATIEEGEMFAIEIYIGEKKTNGTMIKNVILPTTHFEINENTNDNKINKLKQNEKDVYFNLKEQTNNLVYEYREHNNFDKRIIKKLIDLQFIIKHEPLEFKSNTKQKIKYIQYEDCFIIKNGKLINLTG